MIHIIWTSQSYIMCCLASTSAIEANHARLITRGLHHKGRFLFESFKIIFSYLGVPICVLSNHYESMTSLCSIMQNIGFGDMFRSLSKRSNQISTKAGFQNFRIFRHFDSIFENISANNRLWGETSWNFSYKNGGKKEK